MRELGLAEADDGSIWTHALAHGLVIVTKDDDFRQHSFLLGAPPKVIWVRLGNCRTNDIEDVLRARYATVMAFGSDPEAALLLLGGPW